MSLLMLSRLVIAFLPRSKHLLISWLQSLSAVILESKKIKSFMVSIVSSSICHEVMGLDAMILVFWMLSFKPAFQSPLSPSSRGSLVCLCFLTFSLVTQSCLTLCNPMGCSTPGLPIHCQFLEFTQTHVHWVGDAIQPSHPLLSPSHLQSFPASGSFPKSQIFTSVGQSIGVLASASVFQWIFRTDFL